MYPQAELSSVERLINLDDSFTDLPVVSNHQIFLLDDIMETCSTLNAAARYLKQAGASRVGTLV